MTHDQIPPAATDPQTQVRNWELAYRGYDPDAIPSAPIPLAHYNGELRVNLIQEETLEVQKAWEHHNTIELIHELCDLLFVTYGAAVALGVDLAPFFDELVQANHTKIGGPQRSDGKYLKPNTYTPPNMQAVWNHHYPNHPLTT